MNVGLIQRVMQHSSICWFISSWEKSYKERSSRRSSGPSRALPEPRTAHLDLRGKVTVSGKRGSRGGQGCFTSPHTHLDFDGLSQCFLHLFLLPWIRSFHGVNVDWVWRWSRCLVYCTYLNSLFPHHLRNENWVSALYITSSHEPLPLMKQR